MTLTKPENDFIEALGELDRLENMLCCTEAAAERLENTAATIRAGAAISREIQARKQLEARTMYFDLLLATPARRFIKLLEELG